MQDTLDVTKSNRSLTTTLNLKAMSIAYTPTRRTMDLQRLTTHHNAPVLEHRTPKLRLTCPQNSLNPGLDYNRGAASRSAHPGDLCDLMKAVTVAAVFIVLFLVASASAGLRAQVAASLKDLERCISIIYQDIFMFPSG